MAKRKHPPGDAAPARAEVLALLQAVKETPEDDAPRLVLADWLEENGDAERAQLICFPRQHARPTPRPARQPAPDFLRKAPES